MRTGSAPTWDVIVVGGGIVGLASALELQARGRRVLVLDRGAPRARASFGNAGVIGRASILTLASPAIWRNLPRYIMNADAGLRLRYRRLPAIAPWIACFLAHSNTGAWRRSATALGALTALAYEHHLRLADLADARHLLRRDGYLRLFRSRAAVDNAGLEREIFAQEGVGANLLDANALRQLEPSLAPIFPAALFFPESGAVNDPGQLVARYEQAFRARGGTLRPVDVTAIESRPDGISILAQGQEFNAAWAVVAAGAWSNVLLEPLGCHLPFAAERGYHAHFSLTAGAALNRPLSDLAAGYVASPMAGGVRVLTGVELAPADAAWNLRQLRIVAPRAKAALGLESIVAGSEWMGSRPSIADGLPVIGCAGGHPHVVLAVGHGHVGFSTGPVTGRIVADLITGKAPPIDLHPFRSGRFGRSEMAG